MKNHTKIFQVITVHISLWLEQNLCELDLIKSIDGFITIYDGTRYLIFLCPEKYDAIDNIIRYLIRLKSGITDVFFWLSCKKRLTMHNVMNHSK